MRELLVAAAESGAALEAELSAPSLFNTLVEEEERRRFGTELSAQLMVVYTGVERALAVARQGRLLIARRQLDRAAALIANSDWCEEARLIAESTLHATDAYYSYRHGRWQEALDHVAYAGRCDLRLEDKYGWAIYQLHRIQLLHNVMRVEPRRGDWQRGLHFGVGILSYLESGLTSAMPRSDEPWAERLEAERLRLAPAALVRRFHDQIARELCTMLLFARQQAAAPAFVAGLETLVDRCATGNDSQAARWLSLQAAVARGDEAASCQAALPLLRAGRVPSAPLWSDARALVVAPQG